jgi:hypothetical protein
VNNNTKLYPYGNEAETEIGLSTAAKRTEQEEERNGYYCHSAARICRSSTINSLSSIGVHGVQKKTNANRFEKEKPQENYTVSLAIGHPQILSAM